MAMLLPCPQCGANLEHGMLHPCSACGWQASREELEEQLKAGAMGMGQVIGRLHGSVARAWSVAALSLLLNVILGGVLLIVLLR